MQSGIQKILAYGIWNPILWNPNPGLGIQNPGKQIF